MIEENQLNSGLTKYVCVRIVLTSSFHLVMRYQNTFSKVHLKKKKLYCFLATDFPNRTPFSKMGNISCIKRAPSHSRRAHLNVTTSA